MLGFAASPGKNMAARAARDTTARGVAMIVDIVPTSGYSGGRAKGQL